MPAFFYEQLRHDRNRTAMGPSLLATDCRWRCPWFLAGATVLRFTWLLLFLFVASCNAVAGDVRLSWNAPTQNTDGSSLTDLAGFRIHYGEAADMRHRVIDIPNPGITTYIVTGLAEGPWYFDVTAYAASGAESDPSNVVTKTVTDDPPIPNPPGNLRVEQDTTAYVIKQTRDNIALVAVGQVPPGTQCDGARGVIAGGSAYHVVPRDTVSWAGSVRSEIVVSRCEAS